MVNTMADVHVKVNKDIKVESEKVLKQIGISLSDLVNMTLRRVVYERRIPFDTRIESREMPENLTIETKEQLEALVKKSIENDTGKYYGIDEIKERIKTHEKGLSL